MYPPIHISWLLDILPVVIGNIFALPLEDRYGVLLVLVGREQWLLPVSTERKLVLVQELVGSELSPVYGLLVEVGHILSSAPSGCRGMSLYIENGFSWTHSSTLVALLSSVWFEW